MLFLVLGAVSAADSTDVQVKEDSNLDDGVQTSLSQDKLEISDGDSISNANTVNSQDDALSYSDEAVADGNGSNENNGEDLQASDVEDNNNNVVDLSPSGSDDDLSLNDGESVSESTQNKANTKITPDTADTYILPNSQYYFTVTLKSADNKPISGAKIYFTFSDKKVTSLTDKNGKATITIPALPKGTYNITYTFDGDSSYAKSSGIGQLHVQDSTVYFKTENLKMTYKDGSQFKVKVKDAKTKQPLAYVKVKFTINGKTYVDYTNGRGNAYLPIDLAPGTYKIKIKYSLLGKEDYQLVYKEITVEKQAVLLKAFNLNMKYKDGSTYDVIVKQKGKYMKKVYVQFTVNGKTYTKKTNSNGYAKLPIKIGVGYYRIKTVVSDPYYKSNTKSKKVLVDGTKFIAKSIDAIAGKKIVYTLKAVNGKGKPIKYVKVWFKVNDKTYKTKTNKKGIAKVNIGKLNKGTYKIKFARNSVFRGSAKIYVKELSPYQMASANCQVDNEKIQKLVAQLIKGKKSDYDKANAIFDYVRDTISYSFYYDTKFGAVGTLEAGTGNCVDHSHLLVAMYRAAGLSARYVHGTCTFSSGSTYGHVWTQVSINDNWIVGDACSIRNSFGTIVNWNTGSYSLHGYYASLPF